MSGPHDLAAEQAVLGACLLTNAWIAHANLRPEHFYDPTHGALWAEMTARWRADRLADAVSLKEWADANLKDLRGRAYLLDLMDRTAITTAQVSGYSDVLRDLARRRAVIEAAKGAIASAAAGGSDALTGLELRLQEIAAGDADADAWAPIGSIAAEAAERAELGETRGISTGFRELDRATGGIQPGTLWVVGGATSMGKSVFGGALGRNIAAQGYGVGEFHLEMDRTQIGLRTSTALGREHAGDGNPHYLSALRGDLTAEQWERVRDGARAAAVLPIYVDARAGRTVAQIEAAARRLVRKMQRENVTPGALIIDHEGLISAEQRHPSQLEAANARANALLGVAKRLGVGVVALSQITKEGSRADGDERLPTAQDLNYGSALSQAASVVILLHRRAYYAERKPRDLRNDADRQALRSRECLLIIDKSRGGMRTQVTVGMDMPTAAVWGLE